MSFWKFLRGKFAFLLTTLLVVVFTASLLTAMRLSLSTVVYILVFYVAAAVVSLLAEYLPRYHYYRRLRTSLDNLDQKCLLAELLDEPSFPDGKLLYSTLQVTTKSMNDKISAYQRSSSEYREYIETWVHEVKTPIASAKLLIENNKTPVTESVGEEIDRIDQFVEQALFYSRSNSVEKDYLIKKILLKEIVNGVVRKNAKALIAARVHFNLTGLDQCVYTDAKWIDFILGQLLSNAVKYRVGDCFITISARTGENGVALTVRDNGAGIPASDLPRVFEKGFTGQNGRGFARSTGMGLYLCKKLCGRLGLGISLVSEPGNGTAVEIVFPRRELLEQ